MSEHSPDPRTGLLLLPYRHPCQPWRQKGYALIAMARPGRDSGARDSLVLQGGNLSSGETGRGSLYCLVFATRLFFFPLPLPFKLLCQPSSPSQSTVQRSLRAQRAGEAVGGSGED